MIPCIFFSNKKHQVPHILSRLVPASARTFTAHKMQRFLSWSWFIRSRVWIYRSNPQLLLIVKIQQNSGYGENVIHYSVFFCLRPSQVMIFTIHSIHEEYH